MLRLSLGIIPLLFVSLELVFGGYDFDCKLECRDYYYNCNPEALGLESDKEEDIDCDQQKYKLRCPAFCKVCDPCNIEQLFERLQKQVDAVIKPGHIC